MRGRSAHRQMGPTKRRKRVLFPTMKLATHGGRPASFGTISSAAPAAIATTAGL